MSQHHNNHPQPSEVAFMQQFDGAQPEVDASEQQAVAAEFTSFFDDFMWGHIDFVRNRNFKNPEWPINTLKIAIPNERGAWIAEFRESDLPQEIKEELETTDLPDKLIILTQVDAMGNEGREHKYSLGHDGVVRREDAGDGQKEEELARKLDEFSHVPDDATDEVLAQKLKHFLFAHVDADQGEENKSLEISMGLNLQPIGLSELDGLTDFLTSPQAFVIPPAF